MIEQVADEIAAAVGNGTKRCRGVGVVLGSVNSCGEQCGFPDDVFRMAASGGALAVAVPYYMKRPTWRRLAIALGIGIVAGIAIELFAVSATAG